MTRFLIFAALLLSIPFANIGAAKDITTDKRPSTPFAKALAHYTMGIIYDNEGRFDEAAAEYKKSLSIDAKVSYVHTRLAVDYILKKDEAAALEELKKAKDLDPADPSPHFLEALVHTSAGRFEEARKEYEAVIRIDPDSMWALSSLADIFVLQEKMDEAAYIYEKLLEKEESPILYFNLGVIYARIGKTDLAIEKLSEASRLEPDYIEAYIGLGALYETKRDLKNAILNFEKALKIEPISPKLYHHLGYLYYETKNVKEALHQYELLTSLDPANAAAYIDWANIYVKEKAPRDAIDVLEKARASGVKDANLYMALGYIYSIDGDNAKALELYGKARELAPDDAKVRFYTGALYEKAKQFSLAEKEFREAIRLDPDFADAYNYLGYMFAENGANLDEALSLIKKALEMDPENGAYIDSLGWVYFQKGQIAEAVAELEKAAKSDPSDPTIKEHLNAAREKSRR